MEAQSYSVFDAKRRRVVTVLIVMIVYLNSDALRELSDGSAEDDANWKTYLGRNEYTLAAWSSIDEANATWQLKRYRTAIDKWWLLAEKFCDCSW